MSADFGPAQRLPLLALGFIALVVGVAAGLVRLGVNIPLPSPATALLHGPLMVSGFFGTVIGLERAVALARRWAYAAPLLTGLGALALIAGVPVAIAGTVMTLGSLVLLAASLEVLRRQRELFTLTLALGAACFVVGNLVWVLGLPVAAAAPWWMAFFVLTIAGERLELSRFLRPSPTATRLFSIVIGVLLFGVALSVFEAGAGTMLLGAALIALAAWLLRQDIARRTVRERGLTRFIAVCLISGYCWLAIGGAAMAAGGGLGAAGPAYDAALHAVLMGFVFSMVIGHAAIIFPAVLRVQIPYHPVFYLPLVLLHVSLALRIAGDWTSAIEWRSAGGTLNALALAVFILTFAGSAIFSRPAGGSARRN